MKTKQSSNVRMADHELRKLVLERDAYACRRCGKACDPAFLECAHLVPRRYRRVRWNLTNVVTLCKTDHSWLDTHPLAKDEWIVSEIGEDVYRELRRMAEDGQKVYPAEELARLRALRKP